MPKRPCAIALTPDENTILCGDKFGDVYALPLLGELHPKSATDQDSQNINGHLAPEALTKSFVPSASSRTVHTKKNQRALQNQMKLKNQNSAKKTPLFDYQHLLGHVSLLTDLLSVSLPLEDSSPSKERPYIITADRDEHIRVSRGIPQAHVIEGFCLGHTEFVSKLCVLPWNKRYLVSGGGDEFLLVWDWSSYKSIHSFSLNPLVQGLGVKKDMENSRSVSSVSQGGHNMLDPRTHDKLAIRGIWALDASSANRNLPKILVTCEG